MTSGRDGSRESLARAIALHNQGQLEQARDIYQAILVADPLNSDCLHLLGVVAGQQGNNEQAVDLIGKAIGISPGNEAFYCNRGIVLLRLGRHELALADYEQALAINPGHVDAYVYRGVTMHAMNQPYLALQSHDIAVSLAPGNAEAQSNRANTLLKLGLFRDAVAGYDRAIALRPGFVEAHSNRGIALKELGLLDAALESYNKAIEIKPDYAEANANKATLLLLKGELAAGWDAYEWRWLKEANRKLYRRFESTSWQGDHDLTGQTILLRSEQGYGDTIQFSRYARLLSQRGAKVIVEVPAQLRALMLGLQGADSLIVKGGELPAHDFQCSLLSLPRAFNTRLDTIPAQPHYLAAKERDISDWSKRLGTKKRARIGVVWRGSPAHQNDGNRSMRIEHLLGNLPANCEFHSIQKDLNGHESRVMAANPSLIDHREHLTDFSQTAALCHLMDLVISVDTSVAHLSAALGKQTWILLPFTPDWRWMLGRDDSPWYPSMRLFRQQTAGDWVSVVKQVVRELSVAFAAPRIDSGRS